MKLKESQSRLNVIAQTSTEYQNLELELFKKRAICESELRTLHSNITYLKEQQKSFEKLEEEEKKLVEKKERYMS